MEEVRPQVMMRLPRLASTPAKKKVEPPTHTLRVWVCRFCQQPHGPMVRLAPAQGYAALPCVHAKGGWAKAIILALQMDGLSPEAAAQAVEAAIEQQRDTRGRVRMHNGKKARRRNKQR